MAYVLESRPVDEYSDPKQERPEHRYDPNNDMTIREFQHYIDSRPRIMFIAGYEDITTAEFTEHYCGHLDRSIDRGDTFIVADTPGTCTMALQHMEARDVSTERITIYRTVPSASSSNMLSGRFRDCKVKEIEGGETQLFAAMIKDGDNAMLWLRDADSRRETRMSAVDVLDARYTGLKELARMNSASAIMRAMEYYDEIA